MLSPLPLQDILIQPTKFDPCPRSFVTESNVYHDIGLIVSASVSPIPSDSPTLDEDHLSSPTSPPGTTPNFQYGHRLYDEPVSPGTMYDSDQPGPPPPITYSYESAHQTQNYSQSALSSLRDSDPPAPSYLSDSPSPVDVQSSSTLTQPMSSLIPLTTAFHTVPAFPPDIQHILLTISITGACPSPPSTPWRRKASGTQRTPKVVATHLPALRDICSEVLASGICVNNTSR